MQRGMIAVVCIAWVEYVVHVMAQARLPSTRGWSSESREANGGILDLFFLGGLRAVTGKWVIDVRVQVS